jgi:YesN/AraC family two-component response regulator
MIDILMPLMNGLAMTERKSKTPVIITSAFEEPHYFQQAIDLGVDKYVTKPVKCWDIGTVNRFLQTKRAKLLRRGRLLLK